MEETVYKTKWLLAVALVVAGSIGFAAQQPARGGGRGAGGRGAAAPPQPVTKSVVISHEKVAGCDNGGSFINAPDFTVSCTHRNGQPGPFAVEIHTKETDVFYIVDGEATFVTGGTVEGLTSENPLQPRGKSITGGEEHHLMKGDVVVVPAGTPHWFKLVPKSISYFVVKPLKP
jgi:mannose-6-phosphate isomerase-like protein (cupin superfamily)